MRGRESGGHEHAIRHEQEKAETGDAVAKMVERLKNWDTTEMRDVNLLEGAEELLLAAQGLGVDTGELKEAIAAIKNSEGWKIETQGSFSPEKMEPSKNDGIE